MKKIFNKRISVIFTLVILLLIVNVILSFSFMSGKFNNQESVSTLGFKGGNINVIYSNNNSDIIATDIVPGYSVTKQFSITSDFGTNHSYYNNPLWYTIKIIVDKNEFDDNSIKYSINLDQSSSKDGMPFGSNLEEGILKGQNLEGVTVASGAFYNNNQTHVYNLTISYPETRHNQTHESGCEFAAHVEITNPDLINVTFDLKDGASDGLMLDSSNSMRMPSNSRIYFSNLFLFVINGDADYNTDNGVLKTYSSDFYLIHNQTDFDYVGGEQQFVAVVSGYYKLETWGAQGGSICSDSNCDSFVANTNGGYGGYSSGTVLLNKSDILYVNIGGEGNNGLSKSSSKVLGGYNGGGDGFGYTDKYVSGGGGATHIALVSGELSNLSETNDIANILIISGGGGGGAYQSSSFSGVGGSGGGYKGAASGSTNSSYVSSGSTQTGSGTGYYPGTFGKGGCNATSNGCSGGGGGLYGGDAARYAGGGAGGSGYIGNSLLTNKYMYCYNCSTSDVESTKTYSTTCAEETPTENCAKEGNGYARITYLHS